MFLSAVGVLVALRCANRCLLLLLSVASGCFFLPLALVHDVRAQKNPSTPSISQLLIVDMLSLLFLLAL